MGSVDLELPFAESYKIKMTESIRKSTREEREQWLKEANYNMFNLRTDQIYIDLLSDSGTSAMSNKQWSAMMLGDESYAGATSFYTLKKVIKDILGFDYLIPTHQGRGAENVLMSVLLKEGDVIPGNAHFDTTKGHISFRKAVSVDLLTDVAAEVDTYHPFKGNVDLERLEGMLANNAAKQIPMIIMTVTCNNAGGQPVSIANLRAAKELATQYGVIFCMDIARFAENAYFIKKREEGYADKTIREIVAEMMSFADVVTMSAKKDGLVNIGGFVAMRDEEMWKKLTMHAILYEGYLTYGGMSGRDMEAMAQGLIEGTEFDYLDTRIKQLQYLGSKLEEYGVPHLKPVGASALYINSKKIFEHIPENEFRAHTFACELYLESGVRGASVGVLLLDRDPKTGENVYPKLQFSRLAIPRRTYTNSHLDYVAMSLKRVYERRLEVKHGFKIVYEVPIMRHFTAVLERIE